MSVQESALAEPRGARWATPLLRLDSAVTSFETAVAVLAIAAESVSMTVWVFLKGLATPADSESGGVVLFRAIAGAVAFGLSAHVALRHAPPLTRQRIVLASSSVGFLAGRACGGLGVAYFGNVLNFFQQASCLTLLGGLRGTGTRFTLLLALVGGSLATARGKHVVVDVVARLTTGRLRRVFVVLGFVASAAVALPAAWGFFDHIAIQDFGADADASFPVKARQVLRELGEDAFIARTQLLLDVKTVPHVIFRGEPYAEWLHGDEWNAFLLRSGFVERYGREATEALRVPPDETRAPVVAIPGRGEPRGELINAANLVYPVGLLDIGLRFLLRALLVATHHVGTEPDEDDELALQKDGAPFGV